MGAKLKLNKKDVVERFKKTHGDKYDYSEFLKDDFEYKGCTQKIPIICHEKGKNGIEHGIFWQRAYSHYNGKGCAKCNKGIRLTLEEILDRCYETHGTKYDYSLVKEYKSINNTKIPIICHEKFSNGEEHGVFYCTIKNHVNHERGCPKCNGGVKYTIEDFKRVLEEKHGDSILFDEKDYKNYETTMTFICRKHGEFETTPHELILTNGCPHCLISKLESEIEDFLNEKGIKYRYNKTFEWLVNEKNNKLKCDFFLQDYNVVIECQGRQHFEKVDKFGGEDGFNKTISNDAIKFKLCKEHGIDVLYYAEKDSYIYPHKIYKEKEDLLEEIIKHKKS